MIYIQVFENLISFSVIPSTVHTSSEMNKKVRMQDFVHIGYAVALMLHANLAFPIDGVSWMHIH